MIDTIYLEMIATLKRIQGDMYTHGLNEAAALLHDARRNLIKSVIEEELLAQMADLDKEE